MSKRRASITAGPAGWLSAYWPYALVVVVAAATVFLVILAFNRPPAPTAPSNRVSTPSIPSPTESAIPSPSPSPDPTTTPAPTAAFLGDSYTAGSGATQISGRWTTLVSAANGWTELNFGEAQTGFGTSASGASSFSDRVSDVIAANPAIVIVSGGRFDYSGDSSTTTVSTAIAETFKALRAGLPKARLIAMGPIWDSSDVPNRILDITNEIRTAVERANGSFVDIGQPLANQPNLLGPDGLPNDAGHVTMSKIITSAITPIIAQSD